MRVTIDNLSFAYTQKLIIKDLTFSLKSGDFLTIIGKNGTGKSTLVKCILKSVIAPKETILLDDMDITRLKRLYNVGYVPQKNEFKSEFPITVHEILSCAYSKSNKDAYFSYIINELDLNKFYHENINNLSGGQFQRVFIARALLNKPKLLILDEPTAGVDLENSEAIKNILSDLKAQQITIILITHDPSWAYELADYFLELKSGLDYSFDKVVKK